MNNYNDYLKSILVGESKAYGFTIGFWGSGMVLMMTENLDNFINVFSFGLGSVIGFGLLSLVAFKGFLKTANVKQSEFMVLSTVHYFAALMPILLTYVILNFIPNDIGIFLAGANVAITYNLLILVQEGIAEEITALSS